VAAASALLCGCTYLTHPNGTVICGKHLPTGANAVLPDLLQNPGPSPATGPAPLTDQLPPQVPATSVPAPLSYVRVSSSCDHGAIVVVTPANTAKVGMVIRSSDQALTVLGLALNGPVTVQAWQNGVFAGSLQLS
jgi:hypothetical protein